MKKIPLILCLCLSFSAIFAADFPDISSLKRDKGGNWLFPQFYFSNKGEWENKRCWREGKTPDGPLPRVNVIGGATLTISREVPTALSWLLLGFYYDKKTTAHFEKDARLYAGSMTLPTPYVEKSDVDFYMSGGELVVGGYKNKDFNGTLNVGTGITTSGTALFAISGGKLTAGLRVGTSAPNTNTGTFSVRGSQAVITGYSEPNGFIMVWASGTLEFVLDEKGVSTLDYGKNILTLHNGANIVVDGSAYKGGTQQIWLVQAAKVVKLADVNISTRGFPSGYKAEVSLEKKGVLLKISRGK